MAIPPPPPGFTLDTPDAGAPPPPPPGFTLDAPAAAPQPKVRMDRKAFNAELMKRVRDPSIPPAEVKTWAESVLQPAQENAADLAYGLGPAFEEEIATIRAQPNIPTNILNADEKNTALGSMLRGGLDTATFNFADEIQGGFETGFGLAGDYDAAVAQARAARAMDDPTARFTGQLLGGFAPMGLLARGGALGGKVLQGIDKAMDAPTFLGKTARVAGVTGAGGVAAGYGADTDGYGLGDAGTDFAVGATLGSVIPATGAAVTGIAGAARDFFNPTRGALDALNEAVDGGVAALKQRIADAYQRTGKAPAIGDVLTVEESARLTGPLSRSRDAKTRVMTEANARMENLGGEIQDQVRFSNERVPGTSLAVPGQSGRTTRQAATPGDIERATIKRGDEDFGAFRNKTANLNEIDRVLLDRDVLSQMNLSGKFKRDLADALAENRVTGEQFDIIRRQIDALARSSNPETRYRGRALREDFLPILEAAFPESGPAVRRYAAGMAASEGAEVGVRAAKPGSDFIKVVDDINALKDKGRAGLPPGARAGLIAEAYGNPMQSYRLATELASNPGYQERLARALDDDQEAAALSQFALQQKNAIDSLMAMARIPTDKVESNLRNAEGLIDIVAATGSGSAAFKAGVVNNILSRLNIGKPAADKLADTLLDPSKRNSAIAALEKMGAKKAQWRDWVRNAFVMAAGQVANENAEMPEGTISVAQPQE